MADVPTPNGATKDERTFRLTIEASVTALVDAPGIQGALAAAVAVAAEKFMRTTLEEGVTQYVLEAPAHNGGVVRVCFNCFDESDF